MLAAGPSHPSRCHDLFWGGTPSVLPVELLCQIVQALKDRGFWNRPRGSHAGSQSGNPLMGSGSGLIASWALTGWSLGIQSFQYAELAAMGRIHTAEEAKRSHCSGPAGRFCPAERRPGLWIPRPDSGQRPGFSPPAAGDRCGPCVRIRAYGGEGNPGVRPAAERKGCTAAGGSGRGHVRPAHG